MYLLHGSSAYQSTIGARGAMRRFILVILFGRKALKAAAEEITPIFRSSRSPLNAGTTIFRFSRDRDNSSFTGVVQL